jgi:hypothetical protein
MNGEPMYRVFINPSNTHKRGYQLFGVSAPVKRDGDVFVGQLADISAGVSRAVRCQSDSRIPTAAYLGILRTRISRFSLV